MTVIATAYSLYALFRPVIYRFKTVPRDREAASAIVQEYGRSAQDYFKVWPDKSYFFSESRSCFLAYSVGRNFAIVLGDPVGPEEEIEDTIAGFSEFCQDNAWGIGFHQVLPDFLPLYKRLGFKKLKIGDDAIVDLVSFSLQGKGMKEIRHSVNQLEKAGIRTITYDPPVLDDIILQVKEVSDEWLRIPGRRERSFTLGRFETDYIRSTPLYAAVDKDGRMLAFVNLIPSYAMGEATHDLMRRRIEAPNGIMDFLFVKLFLLEKENGLKRFNLGMAPMAGFQEKEEASPEERAIHLFFQRLNFIFSYEGLRHYKAKFATTWEPRYAIYHNVFDLPRFARALSRVSEIKYKG
jgi:phosphatidylglycerol lysyltransferase